MQIAQSKSSKVLTQLAYGQYAPAFLYRQEKVATCNTCVLRIAACPPSWRLLLSSGQTQAFAASQSDAMRVKSLYKLCSFSVSKTSQDNIFMKLLFSAHHPRLYLEKWGQFMRINSILGSAVYFRRSVCQLLLMHRSCIWWCRSNYIPGSQRLYIAYLYWQTLIWNSNYITAIEQPR